MTIGDIEDWDPERPDRQRDPAFTALPCDVSKRDDSVEIMNVSLTSMIPGAELTESAEAILSGRF
jgi:hypothetical protein